MWYAGVSSDTTLPNWPRSYTNSCSSSSLQLFLYTISVRYTACMVRKKYSSEYETELLQKAVDETGSARSVFSQMSVEEARRQRPLIQYGGDRKQTRVLFVTNDTSFLNPTDDSLERFFAVAGYFDEMHILVLRTGSLPTKPVLRVRSNIWVYIASAKYWWWTPVIAHEEIAPKQLSFANGFRADLIVALEPFEAALAARWIGKTFARPVQVHVRQNFYRKGFKKLDPHNKWRKLIARYVLGRTNSIRVQTDEIKQSIEPLCPKTANIDLLPWFYNFQSLTESKVEFDVHEVYPMYKKCILYIGPLDYTSTLFSVIDVLKYVLANPSVGLIVLGDGPIREECENKIKKIGLETQVAFPKQVSDVTPYLLTSDLMIVTDQTALSDELVMQSAVASLPTIMSETEARSEVFVDGENGFVCPDDETCFIDKLKQLVTDNDLRNNFSKQLRDQVAPRLATTAFSYQERYRNTIESAFLDNEEVATETKVQAEEN